MSLYSYQESVKLSDSDTDFDALIMAACRKADSHNVERLQICFPEIVSEFMRRYNAPGGRLPEDGEAVRTDENKIL